MIKIRMLGDFNKVFNYIKKARKKARIGDKASEIAQICIEELKRVTPKDSGITAESWYYEIKIEGKTTSIIFLNKNIQNGVNVALLLEFGHGTPTGGWVEGKEYIDPVIRKAYLNVINNKWKELTKI